jgi:parvulin-like peptidyl-prolyl isomerase
LAKNQPEPSAAAAEDRSHRNYQGNYQENHQEAAHAVTATASILQVGNRTVTVEELLPLLSQYRLLPKLWQESMIDEAIEPFACTPEEQEQCCQEFYTQQQLTSEAERQSWLQQQGLTETQLVNLATRKLRIEKFKQATWGSKLASYFRKRKPGLDQVVYSLLRVQEASTAQELFSRLQTDEQSFAELARQYSQGTEAETGGLIGPMALSTPHAKLARLLTTSQPGQVSPPTPIGEWWVIVRLEKTLPAELNAAMRQRLLDELFSGWLQERIKQHTPVVSQPLIKDQQLT